MFVRCGTPGYVAPEVVNIKDLNITYGPICDVYSLGVIFHIILMANIFLSSFLSTKYTLAKLPYPTFLMALN